MTTLPSYRDALAAGLAGAYPLGAEEAELSASGGRTLAEDVAADRDLPPFRRAQMDGYALRAAELAADRAFPVCATVPAGADGDVAVPEGACVAIATGAPLPADVDTVIQHELSDRGDPVRFTIDTIEPGRAVHPRAADARAGDVVLATGTVLGPHAIGIAAAVGRPHLLVAQRPIVTVLSSGDELRPVAADVAPHQIRDSNGPMIAGLVDRFGGTVHECGHVPDERSATDEAVGRALAASDVVVTIGGVSAGERDHFPGAFATHGVQPLVEGAAIQPGRPVRMGRAGDALVIALPGNPVSALVCAHLFAWPAIRALLGQPAGLPWIETALAEDVRANPRRQAFRPARIATSGRARIPTWAGSGDLVHTAATDGIVELPVQAEPVTAGTPVRFLGWA